MPIRVVIFDLDGTLLDTLEDLAAAVNYALGLRNLPLHSVTEYRSMVGHGVRNLVQQAIEKALQKAEAQADNDDSGRQGTVPEDYDRPELSGRERAGNDNSDRQGTVPEDYDRPELSGREQAGNDILGQQGAKGVDDAFVEAALADFKAYYTEHIDVHTRAYPGMQGLVKRLSERGIELAVASNKFQAGTEKLIAEFFPGIPFVAILGNREGYPLKPDPEIVNEVLTKAESRLPEGIKGDDLRAQAVMVGDSRTDMRTAANGGIRGIAVSWGYRELEESEEYGKVASARELERLLLKERHPFEPFLPENARILFLGSFPPQAHRWSMPFYYPNFQNDFWRILGLIHFGDKDHFCIRAEKRFDQAAIEAFCREKGLAFYDTATEVIRLKDNASDAFLEVVTPTDIPAMLERLPHCRSIVVTGEKASATLADALSCPAPPVGGCVTVPIGPKKISLWRMPSTSRAYPLPLEKKAEAYKVLFEND